MQGPVIEIILLEQARPPVEHRQVCARLCAVSCDRGPWTLVTETIQGSKDSLIFDPLGHATQQSQEDSNCGSF